ncbi:diacylglycerol kinase [Maritimibacter sp. 55A14]|uniref:diacylglycerol kinase n=1 Tax=Maritimibacter sp. 55A14 TaxID=2174844 RepID=UPI000D61BF57|nr:diacylglycerol kinase [Maritimibacter sp. 55A14]PWE33689.1 diacylglycerol kinase [Maritimibacter sp. 55A14]
MKSLWSRFCERAGWSWEGWRHCWNDELSLKQWALANLVSAVLAFWLPLGGAERALILALGVLVMAMELINTAIERAVDFTSGDRHPLAKQAKDTASAAVVVTALAAGVAWLAVLTG